MFWYLWLIDAGGGQGKWYGMPRSMTNYQAWREELLLDQMGFSRKWRFAWDGATWQWDQRGRVALLDKASLPRFA